MRWPDVLAAGLMLAWQSAMVDAFVFACRDNAGIQRRIGEEWLEGRAVYMCVDADGKGVKDVSACLTPDHFDRVPVSSVRLHKGLWYRCERLPSNRVILRILNELPPGYCAFPGQEREMRVQDGSGFVEQCNAERKWEQTHCITPPGNQGRLKIKAGEKWKLKGQAFWCRKTAGPNDRISFAGYRPKTGEIVDLSAAPTLVRNYWPITDGVIPKAPEPPALEGRLDQKYLRSNPNAPYLRVQGIGRRPNQPVQRRANWPVQPPRRLESGGNYRDTFGAQQRFRQAQADRAGLKFQRRRVRPRYSAGLEQGFAVGPEDVDFAGGPARAAPEVPSVRGGVFDQVAGSAGAQKGFLPSPNRRSFGGGIRGLRQRFPQAQAEFPPPRQRPVPANFPNPPQVRPSGGRFVRGPPARQRSSGFPLVTQAPQRLPSFEAENIGSDDYEVDEYADAESNQQEATILQTLLELNQEEQALRLRERQIRQQKRLAELRKQQLKQQLLRQRRSPRPSAKPQSVQPSLWTSCRWRSENPGGGRGQVPQRRTRPAPRRPARPQRPNQAQWAAQTQPQVQPATPAPAYPRGAALQGPQALQSPAQSAFSWETLVGEALNTPPPRTRSVYPYVNVRRGPPQQPTWPEVPQRRSEVPRRRPTAYSPYGQQLSRTPRYRVPVRNFYGRPGVSSVAGATGYAQYLVPIEAPVEKEVVEELVVEGADSAEVSSELLADSERADLESDWQPKASKVFPRQPLEGRKTTPGPDEAEETTLVWLEPENTTLSSVKFLYSHSSNESAFLREQRGAGGYTTHRMMKTTHKSIFLNAVNRYTIALATSRQNLQEMTETHVSGVGVVVQMYRNFSPLSHGAWAGFALLLLAICLAVKLWRPSRLLLLSLFFLEAAQRVAYNTYLKSTFASQQRFRLPETTTDQLLKSVESGAKALLFPNPTHYVYKRVMWAKTYGPSARSKLKRALLKTPARFPEPGISGIELCRMAEQEPSLVLVYYEEIFSQHCDSTCLVQLPSEIPAAFWTVNWYTFTFHFPGPREEEFKERANLLIEFNRNFREVHAHRQRRASRGRCLDTPEPEQKARKQASLIVFGAAALQLLFCVSFGLVCALELSVVTGGDFEDL